MQPVTLATLQLFIELIALVFVGVLHSINAYHLRGDSSKLDLYNKNVELASAAFIGVLILVVFGIFAWRNKAAGYVPTLVYLSLFVAGGLLIYIGYKSANLALQIQCDKADPSINLVWKNSSLSALISISTAFVLLGSQAYLRRRKIAASIQEIQDYDKPQNEK